MGERSLVQAAARLAAAAALAAPPGGDHQPDASTPASQQDLDSIAAALALWRSAAVFELGNATLEIKSVVGAMNRGFASHKVVADAAHLLGNLAASSTARTRQVASEQGLQVIIEALVQYRFDPRVVAEATFALGRLALDEENRCLIADFDGIEATVDAMDAFDDSRELSAGCLRLLVQLVEGNASCNKIVLGNTTAIRKTVGYLARFNGHIPAQRLGCKALGSFVFDCPKNKDVAIQEGAHLATSAAIQKFVHDPDVRLNGLWMLACLCFENRERQLQMGPQVIPMLVSLISGAQVKLFDVLLVFRILRSLTSSTANTSLFINANGVEALTNMLGNHGDDELFFLGGAILCNVRHNELFPGQACDKSGFQTLLNGIETLAGQQVRLEVFMEAFLAIVCAAQEGVSGIVSSKTVFLLVGILESHGLSKLRHYSIQAIDMIVKIDPHLRSQFGKAGIIRVLNDIIRSETISREILASALSLLNNLAEFPGCAVRIENEYGMLRLLEVYRSSGFGICDELLCKVGTSERNGRALKSLFSREKCRAKNERASSMSGALGFSGRSSSSHSSAGDVDGQPKPPTKFHRFRRSSLRSRAQ